MNGDALRAALTVFDDATLETLASKGLLRRARRDVEAGKAKIENISGERASVLVEDQTVSIGADGPAKANCSCPAQGVCRHRLAALLLLREPQRAMPGSNHTAPAASGDDPSPTGPNRPNWPAEATPEPAPGLSLDPGAELEQLGVAGIEHWAGKAASRAAHELLQASPTAVIERDGAALVITLSDAALPVRYLAGQGLDGIVSKAPTCRRKTLHAAAVLAVLRQQAPAQFEASPAPDNESRFEPPSPAYLQQIATALQDCARSGLSLSPQVLEERLFALSVSSRADALPRLSRLLRTLAAAITDKRANRPEFDPRAFLRLTADATALTVATAKLEPEDHERGRELLGRVRQRYHPLGELELYGCGSQVWRTQAGARGVTAWFYAPALERWFSAGITRAVGQDGAFDPRAAWFSDALWGLGPLASIGSARISLRQAAASADGRLSLAKQVRGQSEPWVPGDIAPGWPVVFDHWPTLQQHLSEHFRGGLQSRVPLPVLLRPSASAAAWFDELEQRLVWPLADTSGAWIALSFAETGGTNGINDIEQASARKVELICALAQPTTTGYRLTPLSYASTGQKSALRSIGLDPTRTRFYDQPDQPGLLQRARARAGTLLRRGPTLRPASHDNATQTLLDDALDALQAWAEIGDATLPRIATVARSASHAGLTLPAAALQQVATALASERPERVLAAVYLLSLATEMERQLEWLDQ